MHNQDKKVETDNKRRTKTIGLWGGIVESTKALFFAATWLASWITAWLSRCIDVPNKVDGDWTSVESVCGIDYVEVPGYKTFQNPCSKRQFLETLWLWVKTWINQRWWPKALSNLRVISDIWWPLVGSQGACFFLLSKSEAEVTRRYFCNLSCRQTLNTSQVNIIQSNVGGA